MGWRYKVQSASRNALLTGVVAAGACGIWHVSAESQLNVARDIARQVPSANIDCYGYQRRLDYAKTGELCGLGLGLVSTLAGALTDRRKYSEKREEEHPTFVIEE